nr:helix-turn-helix domain-containing protein [Caldilineaceae bacterium]
DGACWPSLSTIASRTGMSRMQVIREIGKLQELGLIAVEHQCGEKGEHRSNLYILLNVPEVVTDSDWSSNTQLLGVVTHSDHPSNYVLPEQHSENKTQLENKTQRTIQTSRAPVNNNSVGQLAVTSVVVAPSASSIKEASFVTPKRNRKGKRRAVASAGMELPIPLDPPSPSANPTEQALLSLGIGQTVAHRLALRYQAERIQEKLAYLAFLQAERPESVQNPRGWLRKAIGEDYGPPDGFITAEARATPGVGCGAAGTAAQVARMLRNHRGR